MVVVLAGTQLLREDPQRCQDAHWIFHADLWPPHVVAVASMRKKACFSAPF